MVYIMNTDAGRKAILEKEAVLEKDKAYMYARRAEMAGEDNTEYAYYTEKSEAAFIKASKFNKYAALLSD